MNRRVCLVFVTLALGAGMLYGCKKKVPEKAVLQQVETMTSPAAPMDQAKTGEKLFMQHCVECHPGGGNIIKIDKGLHKKALEANGVDSIDGIVGTMRKPGPVMPAYDEKKIPDNDARAIAQYILDTF